ncbi:hypothetical protein H5410_045630 [Solanum commersonii]|uniref:Uncharacterized protein n=1 Tax=Solanum commersonii TaxID=4109 RepID=A0A9J5XDB0_SOLCO|nr:hypothetical protein H5410_045630 [Solanum commersonii]
MMKNDIPILGLCDTTLYFYNKLSIVVVSNLQQALVTLGTFEISIISMSSVFINPQFQKSTDLAENKVLMVTPSKEMRRTIEVPLNNLFNIQNIITNMVYWRCAGLFVQVQINNCRHTQ